VIPSELLPLARKYATLLSLRRERARGEPVPDRAVFKALADEFPGALNELDTLPMDELERRAAAVAGAAAGGPAEPWMAWMVSYHALLKTALAIKLRVRDKASLDTTRAARIAVDAGVDQGFVEAVAKPPAGRLNRLVFATLADRFGAPEEAIKRALFPRGRR
jgi:hypothetical protein